MIRTEARLARQRHGFNGPRPQAPEPSPPGMTARVAAARAVAEAVTHARPLDERFAADLSLRGHGVDPRDAALARSIATVALRRLGTIRKALAERLDKGMPQARRHARMDARRRRGADPLSRCARSRRGRSRGTGRAIGCGERALRRRSPTRCCAKSRANARRFSRPPTRSTTTRRVARGALARDLRRSDG